MGSEDEYYRENPEANEWMLTDAELGEARSSGLAKLSATISPGRRPATATTATSGVVQRLARSLDLDSDELARRIPADTIRRTKYPVQQRALPDGSILFESPPGIIEGPRGLVHR